MTTRSLKRNKAKDIKRNREEIRKKRWEDHFQKLRFVLAHMRAEGATMRLIAEHLKVSLGFVCKWCHRLKREIQDIMKALDDGKPARYRGDGIKESIKSRSRAPKNPRRKITPEHKKAVIEFRNGRYTQFQGPHKIKVSLGLDISHQSIYVILKEAGLVKPQKRKQRKFEPFRRGRPNDLWQIDYKVLEKSGRRTTGLYLLSVKDDHSSAILASEVRNTSTYEDVVEILERTIKMFGPPRQILSDHGTQWYSVNGGISRFDSEFCAEHGIEHIMGRIGKPTTQGKVERWHGTIKKEAHLPPKGSSADEYEKAIQSYIEYYNFERPHRGIGMRIPFDVYIGGLILPDVLTAIGVHEVS